MRLVGFCGSAQPFAAFFQRMYGGYVGVHHFWAAWVEEEQKMTRDQGQDTFVVSDAVLLQVTLRVTAAIQYNVDPERVDEYYFKVSKKGII